MNIFSLKSGSDIRGIAYGDNTELTIDLAKKIGFAFVEFLSKKAGISKENLNIALGRDSRITGKALLKYLAEGIIENGANAIVFGMCTTPSLFHCLLHEPENYSASIMVTASHHPWNRNGFKFFMPKGGLSGNDIIDILNIADKMQSFPSSIKKGVLKQVDYLEKYKNSLKTLICNSLNNDDKPLFDLHVVVDAGNGAGGFYAKILQDLGANVLGSQFLDPDGTFPNHIPNPENKVAMEFISKAVINNKADIGVIFDADCDRAAVVDSKGNEINRNRLIALISAILLKNNKDITIVTDSVTSTGLSDFIKKNGGIHHRFKRGYRNVIDESIRLNSIGINSPLAIETSGHCAFRDNYYIDDGMYLATYIVIWAKRMKEINGSISDLIKDLKEPIESDEIRLSITVDNFRDFGKNLIADVESIA
ncbi:MAG: phosphomannomutase/phosphoglucomutase, partial [Christensenellaceae bacterium]|nr:phosphomannomutase/phosphoglucomutase [Christensenellaceae bacterium]